MNDREHFFTDLEALGERARRVYPPVAVGIFTMLAAYHADRDIEFMVLCDQFCEQLLERSEVTP